MSSDISKEIEFQVEDNGWSFTHYYSPVALDKWLDYSEVHEAMKEVNHFAEQLCEELGVSSIYELKPFQMRQIYEEAAKVNDAVMRLFEGILDE